MREIDTDEIEAVSGGASIVDFSGPAGLADLPPAPSFRGQPIDPGFGGGVQTPPLRLLPGPKPLTS